MHSKSERVDTGSRSREGTLKSAPSHTGAPLVAPTAARPAYPPTARSRPFSGATRWCSRSAVHAAILSGDWQRLSLGSLAMNGIEGFSPLRPKTVVPLTGEERFHGSDLTVSDFWRWGFSDLRTNIVRGILAEYLVATAVGDPSPLRQAWDDFDVTTASGVRVEVKSSAYLQSWNQKQLSRIEFTGLTGRSWSAETNELAAERTLRADVYVFATHTCRVPDEYDPLDLAHWEFQLMTAAALERHGVRSVSKAFLAVHAPDVHRLDELARAIDAAYRAEID